MRRMWAAAPGCVRRRTASQRAERPLPGARVRAAHGPLASPAPPATLPRTGCSAVRLVDRSDAAEGWLAVNVTDVLLRGAACAVLCVVLSSCAGGPRRAEAVPAQRPVLSVDYVLAPVGDDTQYDLEALANSSEPAARLRRAWILLQRKRPQEAVDASATVLYGTQPASTQAEAFARYIRAEAFDAMGESSRGDYERVLELALDSNLRARVSQRAPVAAASSVKTARTADIAVQPRASWNPAPPVGAKLDPMGRIFRITVHHSAMLFRDTSPATAAGQLRVIQKNHMQDPDRRYGDIGYHFLIDPAGRVWEGRDLKWQGAHAPSGNNKGNIGICVLGNFIRGRDGQRPTATELRALEDLIQKLSQRYGIGSDQIFCHSDFVKTECPGPYLEPEVMRIAHTLPRHPVALAPAASAQPLPE